MDVTPRELRDTDIREGFRGYHRDDVDELLERAAATIESQQERVRQLTEKLGQAEARPAGEPATETEDILKRTLVLAQKAADDAVAEAQSRSRQLLEESEAKSRRIIDQAEATARRIHESERARLEAEVIDLGSRREALSKDVDSLEKFEREYRQRLRASVEAELSTLGTFSTDMGPRPEVQDVVVPTRSGSDSTYVESSASSSSAVEAFLSASSPPPAPARPAPRPEPRPDLRPAPRSEPAPQPQPQPQPRPSRPQPPAARPEPAADAPPSSGRPSELANYVPDDDGGDTPSDLDDDAFFATLRDAVKDEAPLGGGDDDFDDGGFFDQDEEEEEEPARRRFRRRR
jgi:DivIVA domain-containing protein